MSICGISRRRLRTAVAATTALVLVAAGCGDDDGEDTADTTTAVADSAPADTTSADTASADTGADDAPSSSAAAGASGDLDALLATAFQSDVTVDDLDPVIVESLERAAEPLTDEQLELAFQCWTDSSCTIPGGGDVSLGIADGFGDNTWRRFSLMEIILQAMTYPEIGEIAYTNASGDLAAMQANVRSLSAQGNEIILTYNDFGPSMYPAYAAAESEGAIVAAYVSPSPEGEDSVAVTVTSDLCQVGEDMIDVSGELTGGTGNLALFTGTPGNPQGAAWQACSEEAVGSTDMQIVHKGDTNWTPAGAFEAATALIATGEDVDVILYDYSTPFVQVTEAYLQANAAPPDYLAWTMDNGLFCQWEELQGTPNEYNLYYTNSLNWAARTALTGAMKRLAGEEVPAQVTYPMPFVPAQEGLCQADKPGDFPASTLVPDSLVEQMLG